MIGDIKLGRPNLGRPGAGSSVSYAGVFHVRRAGYKLGLKEAGKFLGRGL